MLVYPQLATGAFSQFPVRKRRWLRTVVNTAADGSSVKTGDPAAEITEWQLQYAGLTDGEIAALVGFFEATEGTLQSFTFVDPTANLFAWSGELDNPAWETGPLLAVVGGAADPMGGTSAWHLRNSGAGAQSVCQTIAAPGAYLYCLSVYARSSQPITATLLRGIDRAEWALRTGWRRIAFAGKGDPSSESIRFGLEIPAGGALEVFGLQVEPQASASLYRATTTGGVFEGARFRDDALSFTTTDVNRHSATVNIIHASHL